MMSRSSKSFRTIRSLSSSAEVSKHSSNSGDGEPIPFVFEDLLPFVCKKFNCDFELLIRKCFVSDSDERVDTSVKLNRVNIRKSKLENDSKNDPIPLIKMTSLYDRNNRLVEILFDNPFQVPRLLIQALAAIAPFYEDIHKMAIRKCNIDGCILYELKMLLSATSLTSLCLDGCFVAEANYSILLEKGINLTHLSLCRCSITDAVCQAIVSKLHFPAPAEKNLLVLNFSSNFITDEGAKCIGEMLRTNRRLIYLNLAGNYICDEGAAYILDMLKEFPLKYDEIAEKRRRVISYFQRKHDLIKKFMTECEMQISSTSVLKKNSKANVSENPSVVELNKSKNKAEMMAMKLIGRLQCPFGPSNINLKDGWSYCKGNLTLSYLNLSYNNLTYLSVKKTLGVLNYQTYTAIGLFKIILEGNCTPLICSEYGEISALINKKINVHVIKKEPTTTRKGSRSISIRKSVL